MVKTILLVHEYYQQPGGEDQVLLGEAELLRTHGHRVVQYTDHNARIKDMSRVELASSTLWSKEAYNRLRGLLRTERPQVVHCHNTFPLISPAAYYAARAEGVPVVQTLHNYRLFCLNALFFRDGHVCEDCSGKAVPWPGVLHACYRGSRTASGTVAAMLTAHRALGTWKKMVDLYIAPTEFARETLVEGGLPADKVRVKYNFVHPDPGPGKGGGGYALFVGRLSPEKGLDTLLSAWKLLEGGRRELKIVGDGPSASQVSESARLMSGVQWLGPQPLDEVYRLVGEADFLIFPSKVYETFGRTVAEAFAKGTPVVCSDAGAAAELVESGRTGLHFRSGDPQSLAAQVEWLSEHPETLARMRREARAEFETKFGAEQNYRALMEIYEAATLSA